VRDSALINIINKFYISDDEILKYSEYISHSLCSNSFDNTIEQILKEGHESSSNIQCIENCNDIQSSILIESSLYNNNNIINNSKMNNFESGFTASVIPSAVFNPFSNLITSSSTSYLQNSLLPEENNLISYHFNLTPHFSSINITPTQSQYFYTNSSLFNSKK
jgi:hypothetical protein